MTLDDYCFERGAAAQLAKKLGVARSHVYEWRCGNRTCPPLICVEIERITLGAVTRRDLRPKDFEKHWPELVSAAPTGFDAVYRRFLARLYAPLPMS
ncbi:MAG: helix-turn-helix domain-containing protein [Betaproteobacteria bacterium]|nr:helix-turn-helix domain-containing protein [Betaproteobacteria bacterium]